jgi:hypothetical protein
VREGGGTIGQHLLDGVVTGTTFKLNVANISNITQTEVGILGLQIHNELAHRNRQRAMMIFPLLCSRAEQARYPKSLEGVRSSPQRAFCKSGLLRPFGGREAKSVMGLMLS